MLTKEAYVLKHTKVYLKYFVEENKQVNPLELKEMIEQWEFDYDMDNEYKPESLMTDKTRKSNVIQFKKE